MRGCRAGWRRSQAATALCLECDGLWPFVGNKENKQRVYPKGHKWLALDRKTRAIIGVHVGDRSRAGAQALWDSLPEAYRKSAICYMDYWEAYRLVFPEDRHVASDKDSGLTNHIGAIGYFVHHYNFSRLDF